MKIARIRFSLPVWFLFCFSTSFFLNVIFPTHWIYFSNVIPEGSWNCVKAWNGSIVSQKQSSVTCAMFLLVLQNNFFFLSITYLLKSQHLHLPKGVHGIKKHPFPKHAFGRVRSSTETPQSWFLQVPAQISPSCPEATALHIFAFPVLAAGSLQFM